ncbi:MAG: hypothetical protein CL482_11015, partial [Acidobacteria bacterium]|nr:hypothetical protein [Acidobacteriota bacterium]
IGADGILPAADYFDRLFDRSSGTPSGLRPGCWRASMRHPDGGPRSPPRHRTFGTEAYCASPSLLWLSSSDLSFRVLCGAGTVLSGLLAAGVAPAVVLPLLWVCYLSLIIGG